MDGDTILELFRILPVKEKVVDLDYFFDAELAGTDGELVCRVFIAFRIYKYAYIEPFVIEIRGNHFEANCVFEKSAFLAQMRQTEQDSFNQELEQRAKDYLHLT